MIEKEVAQYFSNNLLSLLFRDSDNLYLWWIKSLRFTVDLQFIDLCFWDFLTQIFILRQHLVLSLYEYLIKNYENIKNHCLVDIVTRLRKRKMHPELVKLEHRKFKLSKMRLLKEKKIITLPWTINSIEKAISSMKNNQV